MDPTDIEIAALAATHRAPLGADTVPDENQSHHCFSCEAPIRGLYCDACGQKNDNFRRSIFSLIAELFGSITGLESRIWRTWAALLFKPGKVAREFADGKRTQWTSPVRAFLAMSIILFGYMSFTGTQLISLDVHPVLKDGIDKPAENLTMDDYRLAGGLYFFESRKAMEARNAKTDYEILEQKLLSFEGTGFHLNIGPQDVETIAGETPDDADTSEETNSGTSTSESEDPSGIVVNGEEVSFGDGVQRIMSVVRDPREVNAIFYTWLPRIMFLMMPFSMFIGILFIRGRGNALMYDHLVHAAYIHAVLYFLIFIGIILSRMTPGAPIAVAIMLGMFIYLPASLKRMFGRGWFKTIWTAYGVGFIYLLTIMFVLVALLVFGMAQTFNVAP